MGVRFQTKKPRPKTSELILDAAIRLLHAGGIRGVSVDEIAAGACVTKMTVYKHFASKDLLLGAAVARDAERFRHWLADAVDRLSPALAPATRIPAVFDALEELYCDPTHRGLLATNASLEIPDRNHPARLAAREHAALMRDYLRSLAPTCVHIDALLALIDGACLAAATCSDPAPITHAGQFVAQSIY